jgi:threonine/homoserine/homoserine lactone efflux protein
MTYDVINGLAAFALVTSITPGPNNFMLMSSGAQFGFRRTLPHMLGVSLGFCVMVILVGLGAMQAFDIIPGLDRALKLMCLAFLAYLTVKLATAGSAASSVAAADKPMTFIGAALFQWVNPKAWPMALTAVSLYAPDRHANSILLVAAIFALVNLPSVGIWAYAGERIRGLLTSAARQRAFNLIMAALLALSVLPLL